MWSDADMETKVLFQEMIVPGGIELNIKEREIWNQQFERPLQTERHTKSLQGGF